MLDAFSTTVIEAGWLLKIDEKQTAILKRENQEAKQKITQIHEVELALFARKFMSIAENMGAMLERTALSVNVKERLDFSCAVLDSKGELIANAPHIPVHLGSLGVCVRKVIAEFEVRQGDTYITNHPKAAM